MEEMAIETSTSKSVVHAQVIHAINELHKNKQRETHKGYTRRIVILKLKK